MVFEKSEEANAALSELLKRINEDRRRMRITEQSIERLENSLSALEETVLAQLNDFKFSLERGLPLKIDRLGPDPKAVKAALIAPETAYKAAEAKALGTLSLQMADIKKSRDAKKAEGLMSLENQVFGTSLKDMQYYKNLYAAKPAAKKVKSTRTKATGAVRRKKQSFNFGRGC